MNTYYKITEHPLDQSERALLRKRLNRTLLYALGGIILTIIVYLFYGSEEIIFWTFLGIASMLAVVWLITNLDLYLDLMDQTKEVVQGLITHRTSALDHPNRTMGQQRIYTGTIFFGDKMLQVPSDIYSKFKEGDLIEIHRSKRDKTLIYQSKLMKGKVSMPSKKEIKFNADKKGKLSEMRILMYFLALLVLIYLIANLS